MMNYEPGSIGNDGRLSLDHDRVDSAGAGRRRWLIWGGLLAAIVLAIILWVTMSGEKSPSEQTAKAQQAPSVTVVVPGRQSVGRIISTTGSIAARIDMPVGVAGEGGLVTAVLVQPGQWVRAGQVLATIDRSVQVQTAESLAALINVARSDARLAQAELDRAAALVDRGFISKADLDRKAATRDAANARVRVAQAQLGEAQARNGRLNIRAPAAGLVLTRSVEPGQVVGSGSGTLFRLAKNGGLELRALLSDGDMASVKVGVPADVTPTGTNRTFAGNVWQISPVIDPQTRQGVVRIALRYDPALRPGGFASANIRSGTSQAPLLPQSAIQSDDKGNFVYVVDGSDKVVRRPVTVGQVSDAGVAIASGLIGDERVVVSAGAFLNPGQKVAPLLQKSPTTPNNQG